MNSYKLSLWTFRLILTPIGILLPLSGLIADLDLHLMLFYSMTISVMYLCFISLSIRYIDRYAFIVPHIYPHYNYITSPISNRELLIKEVIHILTHKYTYYIVVVNYIVLIISDIATVQKVAIGMLFILLLFFFTTFFVFFCNSDFQFAWLKRNVALFSIPTSTIAIFGIKGINWLICYAVLLLILSILLSVVYYRKALKAMQEPFEK